MFAWLVRLLSIASFLTSACSCCGLLFLPESSRSKTETFYCCSFALLSSNFLEYTFSCLRSFFSIFFSCWFGLTGSFATGKDSKCFSRDEAVSRLMVGLNLLTKFSYSDFGSGVLELGSGVLELSNVSLFALKVISDGLEIVAKFGESNLSRSSDESSTLLKIWLEGECW